MTKTMTKVALERVRARDLMQREVLTFAADTPIEEAIERLEDQRVGGAPVLDGAGEIIGMLTASDITKSEHVRTNRVESERRTYEMTDREEEDSEDELLVEDAIYSKEDYSPVVLGRTTVIEWMSKDVVSVPPDATLKAVCRSMIAKHVHHVPVADRKKVVGIISTLDVVRCLAEVL